MIAHADPTDKAVPLTERPRRCLVSFSFREMRSSF